MIQHTICDLTFLKYHAKLSALPIGGIACLLAAPLFSDKIIVLKQTNVKLLVLSYNAIVCSTLYILHTYAHYIYFSSYIFFLNVPILSKNIANSIFLDYTSYSQMDWRYIRYTLGKAAMHTTVMHCSFFDLLLRNTNVANIDGIKPYFLLSLQGFFTTISIHSFFYSIFVLFRFLVRSRLIDNIYNSDIFLDIQEYDLDESDVDIVTDVNMDENVNINTMHIAQDDSSLMLEQQLRAVGLILYNSTYDLNTFFSFFSFCYLDFYKHIINYFTFFFFIFFYSFFLHYKHVTLYIYFITCFSHKLLFSKFQTYQLLYYY
jgi:hypothetical protein